MMRARRRMQRAERRTGLGRAARAVALLAFCAALVPLGAIGYAVLALRCCGAGSGAEPAAWLLVALLVPAAAALVAALAGGIAEAAARFTRHTGAPAP